MKVIRSGLLPRHLDLEEILDWLDGRAGVAALVRVQEHLRTCRRCTGVVDEVRTLVSAMRSDRAELPPEWARHRARALFEPAARPARLSRRLSLAVVFDSWLAPSQARAPGPGRRLMLRGVGLDVDLEVESELGGESAVLHGQALPTERSRWPSARVTLTPIRGRTRAQRAGTRLMFRFGRLARGRYSLLVVGGGHEYVFQGLEI